MILCGGMACNSKLYVLWQKGIRGKLWHYIRDFYSNCSNCSSKRRVQYNRHLSKCFYIDMGVAQGDTHSGPVVYPV
jgi:hypothetical protein